MKNKFLALIVVALPVAAFSQVSTVGPFTGTYSDGFETYSPMFYTSLAVFGGQATMNSINDGGANQGMDVTSGWGFYESISPHSGNLFMGGAGSDYSITFNTPATEFGAYFGTNSNLADAVATFYDTNGNQIGSSMGLSAPLGSWAWDGWSDPSGIKTIKIVADNQFNGFIDIDDMQLTPAPEPCTIAALGLGVVALVRRRRSRG